MATITYEQFVKEDDKLQVESFLYYGDLFKKCAKSRRALNKTLETNYVAVYRYEKDIKDNPWKADKVDWDAETFMVIAASGKHLLFTNSEWGAVHIV